MRYQRKSFFFYAVSNEDESKMHCSVVRLSKPVYLSIGGYVRGKLFMAPLNLESLHT